MIQKMIGGRRVPPTDVPADYQKIGIVRHPVDRFFSLYKHFKRGGPHGKATQQYYETRFRKDKTTPKSMWEYIVEHPDEDAHWRHQYLVSLDRCDILVKLTSFDEWWEKEYGEKPLHVNVDPNPHHCVMDLGDPDFWKEIERHYELDLMYWEKAWRCSEEAKG